MDAIEEIKAKLASYPSAQYTESPSSIEVHPQNESGFAVSLHLEGGRFAVHFEGWHEHFESKDEAAIDSRLSSYAACRVVLEVGTHSPWVSRCVARHGHETIVANPRRVRLIAENDSKSDGVDAELLARLGRVDPYRIVYRVRGEAAEIVTIFRASRLLPLAIS